MRGGSGNLPAAGAVFVTLGSESQAQTGGLCSRSLSSPRPPPPQRPQGAWMLGEGKVPEEEDGQMGWHLGHTSHGSLGRCHPEGWEGGLGP